MLLNSIQQLHTLPQALAEELASLFTRNEYSKRTVIIQPGMLNQKLYFIEKGLIREYYVFDAEDESDNEREITAAFSREGQFTFTTVPFITGSTSKRYIQTLEHSTIYSVSYQKLQELACKNTAILFWLNVLYEQRLIHQETRLRILQTKSSEEGYILFKKRFGEMAERIPDKSVASYLNISTGTLSRLRH